MKNAYYCINMSKIASQIQSESLLSGKKLFLSFDIAKVQSDYPIDKNKKIRLESDEPKSSETPVNTGKRKIKKKSD